MVLAGNPDQDRQIFGKGLPSDFDTGLRELAATHHLSQETKKGFLDERIEMFGQ